MRNENINLLESNNESPIELCLKDQPLLLVASESNHSYLLQIIQLIWNISSYRKLFISKQKFENSAILQEIKV